MSSRSINTLSCAAILQDRSEVLQPTPNYEHARGGPTFEPLEPRLLLSGSMPTLPGLHPVDTDIEDISGQVIYLDFNGEQEITYNGPVSIGPFDVPEFQVPGNLTGTEPDLIGSVLGSLNDTFENTGIIFATSQPADDIDHSTIYVGGTDTVFAEYGSFLGLAEHVDVGNKSRSDNAFVFADSIGDLVVGPDKYVSLLAGVIAHETGRLLGYENTSKSNSLTDWPHELSAAIDAIIVVATIDNTVIAGNTLSIPFTVFNTGTVNWSYGIGAEIWQGSTLKASNIPTMTSPTISPGNGYFDTFEYTIPSNWSSGTYTARAAVWTGSPGASTFLSSYDENFPVEARTTDAGITISPISTVVAGETVTVNYTVTNNSNYSRSFGVGGEIWQGGTMVAPLGNQTTSTLAAGSSTSDSFTYTTPTNWSGSYFARTAVWTGTPGSSTQLGTIDRSFSVTARTTDAGITISPISTVVAGETVTVNYTVTNNSNYSRSFGVGGEIWQGGTMVDGLGNTTTPTISANGGTWSGSFTYTTPANWGGSYFARVAVWDGTPGVGTQLDTFDRSFSITPQTIPDITDGRIAWHSYTAYDDDGTGYRPLDGSIHVYDFAVGGHNTRAEQTIATGVVHAMNPNFSSDGRYITFMGLPTTRTYNHFDDSWANWLDMFVYDFLTDTLTNVSAATSLSDFGEVDEDPVFSPSGDSIVFKRNRADLWAVDLAGYSLRQLTAGVGEESGPQFSPDGSWIIFWVGDGANAFIAKVAASSVAATTYLTVINNDPVSYAGDTGVQDYFPSYWDNSRIIYTSWDTPQLPGLNDDDDIRIRDVLSGTDSFANFNSPYPSDDSDAFAISSTLLGFSSRSAFWDLWYGDPISGASRSLGIGQSAKHDLGGEYSLQVVQYDPNQAPTDISLSNSNVPENQPTGTAVGNLSTVDPDNGDTFTYSLVSGTGSADNTSYTISNDVLTTATSFDYEFKASHNIRVRSTDQGGLYTEKQFTISVTNVQEPPMIAAFTDSPDPIIQGNTLTLTTTDVRDTDGTISLVQFYRDSDGNGTLDTGVDDLMSQANVSQNGNTWTWTGSTSGLPLGLNTYFVLAVDNDGLSAQASTTGTVNPVAPQAPTIGSLTASPDPVIQGDTLTLTALNVLDDGTISLVEFYRDSNGNGTLDTGVDDLLLQANVIQIGNDWQWVGSTSGFPLGLNTYFVRAEDNDGLSAQASTTGMIGEPPLDGDLDGDGFVGIDDLNIVLGVWNQNVTPGDPLAGDPTGDGFVGIDDLNTVLGNWNAGSLPTGPVELRKLTASDAAFDDRLGGAVALTGNLAVVAASKDDYGFGNDSGSVYVFDINTGTQLWKLTPPDPADNDNFGSSVAASGNYAVIGSRLDDTTAGGMDSGSAYVFDLTTGQYLRKLKATDASSAQYLGHSVAVDGNLAIVGATAAGPALGSAYIFDITTGNQVRKLTASDGNIITGNVYGVAVAISGNYAVVGDETGAAYVYDLLTGQEIHKLTAPGAAGFGGSVAIDNGLIIVGAQQGEGSAYIFDLQSGNLIGQLTASDASPGSRFGISVAISSDTAVIGAYGDNSGTGAAYLFDLSTLSEVAKLTASDAAEGDWFGLGVAVSGSTAVIGAWFDDGAVENSGSAYVFSLPSATTPPVVDAGVGDVDALSTYSAGSETVAVLLQTITTDSIVTTEATGDPVGGSVVMDEAFVQKTRGNKRGHHLPAQTATASTRVVGYQTVSESVKPKVVPEEAHAAIAAWHMYSNRAAGRAAVSPGNWNTATDTADELALLGLWEEDVVVA